MTSCGHVLQKLSYVKKCLLLLMLIMLSFNSFKFLWVFLDIKRRWLDWPLHASNTFSSSSVFSLLQSRFGKKSESFWTLNFSRMKPEQYISKVWRCLIYFQPPSTSGFHLEEELLKYHEDGCFHCHDRKQKCWKCHEKACSYKISSPTERSQEVILHSSDAVQINI